LDSRLISWYPKPTKVGEDSWEGVHGVPTRAPASGVVPELVPPFEPELLPEDPMPDAPVVPLDDP
jgi:hypothetical protein